MSERRIEEIPIYMIDPFPDHPFKVQDDEDMDNLIESIRSKGVLMPCIVRPKKCCKAEGKSIHHLTKGRKERVISICNDEVIESVIKVYGPQITIMSSSGFWIIKGLVIRK